MRIIKDTKTSLLLKSFLLENQDYLSISVLCYFDLDSPELFLEEQAMFKESRLQLGKTLLDSAMPKPKAEVLLAGSCHNPLPQEGAARVRLSVGEIDKELYVLGERRWQGGTITKPLPFKNMPLDYVHAVAVDDRLPNIEDPKAMTATKGPTKRPAGFMPLELFREENRKKLGTYDAAWKSGLWPGFAADMDYSFFNVAPQDQQLEGFFKGAEPITLRNMHPEEPFMTSHIPETSMRCFATITQKEGEETFQEVPLQRDTLWLFPELKRGIIIFRGTLAVADEISSDIRSLNLQPVRKGEPLKSLEEYYALQTKRVDRSVTVDEAPLEEMDAEEKKAEKELFDMPREFQENVDVMNKKRPTLQRTSAERVAQTHALIDDRVAQIDKSMAALQEEQALSAQHELQGLAAEKEELLASKQQVSEMMAEMDQAVAESEEMKSDARSKIAALKVDPRLPEEERAKIDAGFLEPKVKTWSDHAFDFLSECVKRLERSPQKLHELRHLGLSEQTIRRSWIGLNEETKKIPAESWALKSDEEIRLREGFVLPRFEEATLKSLRIDKKPVLGSDATYELFLSETDSHFPLFYLQDEIEAHLCDQEAYDICNTLVCDDIATLSKRGEEALKNASVIFYLQEDGTIENLESAKKFDCGDFKDLFEMHQNGVDIREQLVENLPPELLDTLPVKRDLSVKAVMEKTQKIAEKVGDEMEADADALKKELQAGQDAAIEKANKTLAKEGLEPIKPEPHHPSAGFIRPAEVAKPFDKAITTLKKEAGLFGKDFKEQIAALETEKEKMVALSLKGEQMYAEGVAEIARAEASLKGPLPEWAEAAEKETEPLDEEMTREKVIAYHAEGKSLQGRDLSDLDLSELDLSGIDLKEAILTHTDFSKSDLTKADLEQASLSKTDLTHADLSQATLSSALFTEAILKETVFDAAMAENVLFKKVVIEKSSLNKMDLTNAVFQQTAIQGTSMRECSLKKTSFSDVTIEKTSFEKSDLEKVSFSRSAISASDFTSIDSKGMLFNNTTVTTSDFSDSRLYNMRILKASRFEKCDLSRCDMDKSTIFEGTLVGCDLQQTTLNSALIKKSGLEQCDFRAVVAKKARFEFSTFIACPLTGINLFKGSLRQMQMSRCDLSHSNLYAVEMYKTKLFEVDFTGANLKRSSLDGRVELIYD